MKRNIEVKKAHLREQSGIMALKILITGINGFIGSALASAILRTRSWEVYGLDISGHKLGQLLANPQLHFVRSDIALDREQVENHVRSCDVVIPLAAIAQPALYISSPINVFQLDFEENLRIVRLCVEHRKRIIFPSTSEVYGKGHHTALDEDTTDMIYGPIQKQRWIYAASKQLLDRLIYAYGVRDDLDYTIFRPFNFIGPNLDSIEDPNSRVLTQFVSNLLQCRPIKLVNGGEQRRSFTYIDDGVECLLKVIENPGGRASKRIFNIGNPSNCVSISDLAARILNIGSEFPQLKERVKAAKILRVTQESHYGQYYEDVELRLPDVSAVAAALSWLPAIDLDVAIRRTIMFYLEQEHLSQVAQIVSVGR